MKIHHALLKCPCKKLQLYELSGTKYCYK